MMSSTGFLPMQDRMFSTQEVIEEQPSVSKSSISCGDSEPRMPPDSPGSSVSSRLQEEYDELLKFAVVVPSYPMVSSMGLGRSLASGDYHTHAPLSTTPLEADPPVHPTSTADRVPVSLPGSGVTFQKPTTGSLKYKATAVADVLDPFHRQSRDNSLENEHELRQMKKSDLPSFDHGFKGDKPSTIGERSKVDKPFTMGDRAKGDKLYTMGEKPYAEEVKKDPVWDRLISEQDNESVDSELATTYTYTATIDPDFARMENLMDQWTADLKKNIMGEFGQTKIRLIEHHRQQMLREKQRHAGEANQLQNQIEELRELLSTYEQSILRKDQVISNLTAGLQHHRNRMEIQRSFGEWKIKHNDAKREEFALNLARKHHNRTLQQKVWAAWHSIVEAKWRQRVEKACQAKAQEVCMSLTNDYETKLASLNEALETARQEVCRLHDERDRYEETMKKAFMRGVCALNLEAMTMFHDPSESREPDQGKVEAEREVAGEGHRRHFDADPNMVDQFSRPVTIAQEYVYHSEPSMVPSARVVNGRLPSTGAPSSRITDATRPQHAGRGAKVVTARITASNDPRRSGSSAIAGQTLAPPMPSVVVERHQPITKQTIGQATAAKYPQQVQRTSTPPGVIHRKMANQHSSGVNMPMTNIQTVRVVE